MTDCIVARMAREHRRLWAISCPMDDQSEEFDVAVDAMTACRLLASHHTPTSEEGWAFLAYILTWHTGKDRDDFLISNRVTKLLEDRHYDWPAAA
jgi:hypothetical protein